MIKVQEQYGVFLQTEENVLLVDIFKVVGAIEVQMAAPPQ